MKKVKSFVAVSLAVMLAFSTNVVSAEAASKVKVTKVKAVSPAGSKKTAYVAKGKSVKLSKIVKIKPASKATQAMKKVTWRSANSSIAKVSKKGVVKGKKLGTTKIIVTSVNNRKKKATIKINVVKPVKKVSLNKTKMTLIVGYKEKLKATVKGPKKSYKKVKWTSSNKKVATVSKKGVVKAIAEGTAVITAKALDGTKKKASCTVTVNKASVQNDVTQNGTVQNDAIQNDTIQDDTVQNDATNNDTNQGDINQDDTNKDDTNQDDTNKDDTNQDDYIEDDTGKEGIKSVEIVNEPGNAGGTVVRVTLYSANALSKADFQVAYKTASTENYGEVVVKGAVTTDNIVYTLFIDKYIRYGNYYRVTVDSLDGIKIVEKQLLCEQLTTSKTAYNEVGEKLSYWLSVGVLQGGYQSVIESGTLPSGIKLYDDLQQVFGYYETVVDNETVTIKTVDKLGTPLITDITFVVGDEEHIVATNRKVGFKGYDNIYAGASAYTKLYAKGGSGNYNVELIDPYDGAFYLDETTATNSSSVYLYLDREKQIAAQIYTVRVKFTDQENPELSYTATVEFNVQDAYKIVTTFYNATTDTPIKYYNLDTGETISGGLRSFDYNSGENVVITDDVALPEGHYVIYSERCGKMQIFEENIYISEDTEFTFTNAITTTISGTVYGNDGNVYSGKIDAKLYDANNLDGLSYASCSYSNGVYTFKNIPEGEYVMLISDKSGDGADMYSGVITVTDKDAVYDITTDYTN